MPLLALSVVIGNGSSMLFHGERIFDTARPYDGVAYVRKAVTGVQGRTALYAKMECLSCGHCNLKKLRRRNSVGGQPLERAEHQVE